MGFGNRGGGDFRGGRGGRGGFGRGGGRSFQSYGPPDEVTEIGVFLYPCQEDLVCKNTNEKIPYFNAPIYLENKQQIGKIDEIFGSIKDSCFSVKLSENMKANSFKGNQKLFIDPAKLLPLARFLTPQRGGGRGRGGRGRGGPGGGRGGGRGGFGGGRGGGRGGFGGGRGGFGGGRGRGGGGGYNGGRGGRGGGFSRGGGGFKRGRY
ncbi:ACA ribonucleoprotein complex subunit 1 [Octopus vulgaris]|nr:ACA ribonucleoprotein complex subunit 1 [Octopus vulgaris]